jgi:hypothetical protein
VPDEEGRHSHRFRAVLRGRHALPA